MSDLFSSTEGSASAGAPSSGGNTVVTIDVVYRSQVGACIPFTALPKHYMGKKVRLVIVGEADE